MKDNLKRKEGLTTTTQKQYMLVEEKVKVMIEEMKHYSESVKMLESNLFTILDDVDRLKAGLLVEGTPGSDPAYKKIIKRRDEERVTLGDEVKITELVKTFQPEEVFIINTNWNAIQEQLKIKFGINNPNISVKDYHDEIINVADTLQNKPFGTTLSPTDTTTSGSYSTTAKPKGPTQKMTHTGGVVSVFEKVVEDNSLYIKNVHEQKASWIKIGENDRKTHIMFSINTNNGKNFKAFNYLGVANKFSFQKMLEELKLNITENKDIKDQLFGPGTKDDMYKFLSGTIGLTPVLSKNNIVDGGITMWGYDLNKEVITKHTKFGKNIILLDKLYIKIIYIKMC